MMELGILTPEEGLTVINTGVFPDGENIEASQKKFLEMRKEGYFVPLVNSLQLHEEDDRLEQQDFDNELALKQQKQAAQTAKTPAKTPVKAVSKRTPSQKGATQAAPSGGRPMGTSNAEQYSAKKITEVVKSMNEFELRAYREFGVKYGMEELEESKKDIVSQVCQSIIASCEMEEWDNKLKLVVEDYTALADTMPAEGVLEIGEKHQLDDLAASILYHSRNLV
jgi:hypothetical protein